MEESPSEENDVGLKENCMNRLVLTFGEKMLTATLADNSSAVALAELL